MVYEKPFGYRVVHHGYSLMCCPGHFKVSLKFLQTQFKTQKLFYCAQNFSSVTIYKLGIYFSLCPKTLFWYFLK